MTDNEHSNGIYEPPRVFNFKELQDYLKEEEFKEWWVFRAQPRCLPLKTTLERCCENWGLQRRTHIIEEMMIREFRRVYEGEDRQDIGREQRSTGSGNRQRMV